MRKARARWLASLTLITILAALLGVGPWMSDSALAARIAPVSSSDPRFHDPKPIATANLILNSTFEDGIEGWSAWHGTVSSQTKGGRRGSVAARVDYVEPQVLTDRDVYRLTSAPGVIVSSQTGTVYQASAWVKGDGSSIGKIVWLVVREYDGAGNQVESASLVIPLRKSWKQLTVSHTIHLPDTKYVEVYVAQSGAAAGDHFLADDLVLTSP